MALPHGAFSNNGRSNWTNPIEFHADVFYFGFTLLRGIDFPAEDTPAESR